VESFGFWTVCCLLEFLHILLALKLQKNIYNKYYEVHEQDVTLALTEGNKQIGLALYLQNVYEGCHAFMLNN
jgi:hypothetical protein